MPGFDGSSTRIVNEYDTLGDFAVPFRASELIDGLTVPIELEPTQAVEDRENCAFRGTRAVRVFDAQQHLAAFGFGVQPIEKGRTRTPDMKEAGGRRRETGEHGRSGQRPGNALVPLDPRIQPLAGWP